jgi:hypothetical protein
LIEIEKNITLINDQQRLPLLVVSKPSKLEKFEHSLGGSQLLPTNQDYDN